MNNILWHLEESKPFNGINGKQIQRIISMALSLSKYRKNDKVEWIDIRDAITMHKEVYQ